MEAIIIIALREGLEAFLILGIVLAFLEKTALQSLIKYVWSAFFLGILLSFILGFILTVIINGFESADLQYNISLVVLFIAIILLTYMLFWMREHSEIENIKRKILTSNKQSWITFFIVFTAILREGLETVLFVLALMIDGQTSLDDVILGLSIGLSLSALIIYIFFKAFIKVPLQKFFQYSSYLILLIVAGLVGLFIKGLQAYAYLPTLQAQLYDISFFVSNTSILGKILAVLMGYDATPSLLQFLGWSGYILLLSLFLFKKKNHNHKRKPQ
ncbi:MAG: FTR1 family protein [Sulfurovum sp.]